MHKGNKDGRIMIVQDSPTKFDLEQGVPFVGPPGWRLKSWLEDVGIDLHDVYFANLDVAREEHFEVIVPTGEESCAWFLPGYPKLNKVRGSIYQTGRGKVIPTLHPKEILFNSQWEYRCRADWLKIKEQANGERFEPPVRNHLISPDIADIEAFLDGLGDGTVVSLDIETWGGSIKCIGFAANERESIVIPTEKHYWAKRTGIQLDLDTAWDCIKEICQHPCEKVMQNGLFDTWWLEEYGIKVKNYVWDTLAMHHALWPRDNHSLDYLASIYTNQPYWKDSAKEADEIVKIAKQGMDKLYIYNGLDCTVTHEIYQKLLAELEAAGMLDFYKTHYTEMYAPLLGLMRTGVPVDAEGMRELRATLLQEARDLRDKAGKIVGKPLFIFDKTRAERDALEWYCLQNGISTASWPSSK